MRTSSILLICLAVLTAFVVFSVSRIEYLNAAGGHVLPRHDVEGKPRTWEIAELDTVMNYLDDQFLERRQLAARVDAYDKGETEPAEVVAGAPYSVSEQRAIDKVVHQHNVLTKLHWSIKNIGWAQYFVAPASLLLAFACGFAMKGWMPKLVSICCACLSCTGIFFVLLRGYWQALG